MKTESKNRKKLNKLIEAFQNMQMDQDMDLSYISSLRSPWKEEELQKKGITIETLNAFTEAEDKAEKEIIDLAIELNDMEIIFDIVGSISAIENYMDMGPKITGDSGFVEKFNIKQKMISDEIVKKNPKIAASVFPGDTSLGRFEALIETYKDYGIDTAKKLNEALKYYWSGPTEVTPPICID